MSRDTQKDRYTTADMLETARRLRAPGVSQRSGRKLKRRSAQPGKERDQFLRVILILGFLVAAVVIGFASWWLTRLQEDKVNRPDGVEFIPKAPPAKR